MELIDKKQIGFKYCPECKSRNLEILIRAEHYNRYKCIDCGNWFELTKRMKGGIKNNE